MARVDLQCSCGHMFFVGDAQLSQKGGVKCPACLQSVSSPQGAAVQAKSAAPKAVPKAAPRPAPAPVEDVVEASPAVVSNKKIYIVAGVVGTVVVAVIVVLAILLSSPGVDYEKQAELAERERRKKLFEEISSSKPGPAAPSPAPQAPRPQTPDRPVRSTEYRPMPMANKVPEVKAPAGGAGTDAKPQALPGGLNPAVVARLRSEVLTLHPYYLNLILSPAEKARMDAVASTGRGLPEDSDFVQALLIGAKLKAARDEMSVIAQTLPTLERESQENLPVDRITLADGGRVLNCKILDEGTDVIKVARTMSSGVGGQMPIRRENITRIEKGKGVGTEFLARWETTKSGTIASQVELLVWCKENGLAGQAKLVAFTILKSDPSNTQARTEASLAPDPVKNAEEVAKGGIIAYQGKNWNPRELKEKFLRDGYCLVDGQWYSKKEKMISVPGLFAYERQNNKPVILGGTTPVCNDVETTYKIVQQVESNSFVEQPEIKYLRRFYSPQMAVALTTRIPPGVVPPVSTYDLDVRMNVDDGTPSAGTAMKGEVTIHVPVGDLILEASVVTLAEVKAGGAITVYHVAGSGEAEKRTKLYMCDPREDKTHIIPSDLVRGLNELNLVAVIEQPATYASKIERRHVRSAVFKGKILTSPAVDVIHYRLIPEYKAVLFPSTSNTVEVFRVKVSTADPSPMINKLFASNPDVLR